MIRFYTALGSVFLLLAFACHKEAPKPPITPVVIHVVGSSMEPTLHDGQSVILGTPDFSALHLGLIAVFQARNELVIHRIVQGGHGRWVTRGDANTANDPSYLTADNYVGTVALILPKK